MATYIANLAAARKAHTATGHALATALKHVTPPDAEMHALFLTIPRDYATALRKIADIVDSLPRLRFDAKAALDALAALEADACYRCGGSGEYSGATNATRRGVPYCFYCDGTGMSAKARKATQPA